MRYTLKLATLFRIPVRLHLTFPLVLLGFGVEGLVRGGWSEALSAVLLVVVAFTCVVIHELGHSLQGRRYGLVVRDIVLLPIGGMARAERIPENPWHEIATAIAGPAVSLSVAAVIGAVMWFSRRPFDVDNDFLSRVLTVNLGLALFNLIPAFPMDGGRILRGLLATRMPYLKATRCATGTALVIAQVFAAVGFVYQELLMLCLIALFVFAGAMNEERMIRDRFLSENCDGGTAASSTGPFPGPWEERSSF